MDRSSILRASTNVSMPSDLRLYRSEGIFASFQEDPVRPKGSDDSYIVSGEVVSAAQAARELGVSAGCVTHMIDAGILDGYRSGRRTFITRDSIDKRLAEHRGAGRPRKAAMA